MKTIKFILPFIIFPILSLLPSFTLEAIEAQEDVEHLKCIIDFVAVEDHHIPKTCKVYLTSGAILKFQPDYLLENILWQLIAEFQPGEEVIVRVNNNNPGFWITIEGGRFSYLAGLDHESIGYLPKIVEIQNVSTGWFSSAIDITLTDGSTWRAKSDLSILNEYWEVGDAVIYSPRFQSLINVSTFYSVLLDNGWFVLGQMDPRMVKFKLLHLGS